MFVRSNVAWARSAIVAGMRMVVLLAASASAWAAGSADVIAPETFVPGGGAIRVQANLADDAGISEARLYFRGDLDEEFAYSPLRSDGERYLGRIPAPDAAVSRIEYQLLVVNGSNEVWKTQVFVLTPGGEEEGQWQEVASTENAEVTAEYLDATAPKSFAGTRFNIADATRWYGRIAQIYRNAQLAGSPAGSAALAQNAGTVVATHATPAAAASGKAESESSDSSSSAAAASEGMGVLGYVGAGLAVAAGAAAAGGGDDEGEGGAADIVGVWRFSLRCEDSQVIVINSVPIQLNESSGGSISGSGSGTDVGGAPISVQISGAYSSSTKVLSGQVSGGARVVGFSANMSSGDTGWVATQNVSGAGCPAGVRFVRG